MAKLFVDKYKLQYPHLEKQKKKILDILEREEVNFEKTIERGVKELDKLEGQGEKITGEQFLKAQKKHQDLSRKGAAGKFKGGLADHSDITTRYHTATHLLLKALQIVLGDHVHQRGSNITQERLRFDFSHDSKLTDKELKSVEKLVNEKIKEGLVVYKKVMDKDKAIQIGAEHEFDKTYPDKVSVYFMRNPKTKEVFTQEFCGGPHVKNTKDLTKSGKFKIVKEESSSAGIRRIKAILK